MWNKFEYEYKSGACVCFFMAFPKISCPKFYAINFSCETFECKMVIKMWLNTWHIVFSILFIETFLTQRLVWNFKIFLTVSLHSTANFHLRNGAILWRLNWMADTSRRGMERSFGIMTNYKYDLSQITNNNKQYVISGEIAISDSVQNFIE